MRGTALNFVEKLRYGCTFLLRLCFGFLYFCRSFSDYAIAVYQKRTLGIFFVML